MLLMALAAACPCSCANSRYLQRVNHKATEQHQGMVWEDFEIACLAATQPLSVHE
jgi:hypothetical protein